MCSQVSRRSRATRSPRRVLCTAVSYGLLGFYDVLALRYLNKTVSYGRTLFTSFIAYAFGHNFGIAAFTGAAVRYRLYSSAGLNAADVAAVSAFCGEPPRSAWPCLPACRSSTTRTPGRTPST